MTDSYYEVIDDADPLGEKFRATDLVRSTWSAALQHAAPVSALLVRALERSAARDDTRLSRVAVDLLGPVPADGDLWDAMAASLNAEDPDGVVVPYCLSAGTDAKWFSKLGIRCFGFSPLQLPSELDFAGMFHGIDERVDVESLHLSTEMWIALAHDFLV